MITAVTRLIHFSVHTIIDNVLVTCCSDVDLCFYVIMYIQIDHLQARYDKMVAESKKSGNCFYWEPLRAELNDTFGVMKNVNPDSVFSNLKGLQIAPNSDVSKDSDDGDIQLVSPDKKDEASKKERKCKK